MPDYTLVKRGIKELHVFDGTSRQLGRDGFASRPAKTGLLFRAFGLALFRAFGLALSRCDGLDDAHVSQCLYGFVRFTGFLLAVSSIVAPHAACSAQKPLVVVDGAGLMLGTPNTVAINPNGKPAPLVM